jgi:hypothetical protein
MMIGREDEAPKLENEEVHPRNVHLSSEKVDCILLLVIYLCKLRRKKKIRCRNQWL